MLDKFMNSLDSICICEQILNLSGKQKEYYNTFLKNSKVLKYINKPHSSSFKSNK